MKPANQGNPGDVLVSNGPGSDPTWKQLQIGNIPVSSSMNYQGNGYLQTDYSSDSATISSGSISSNSIYNGPSYTGTTGGYTSPNTYSSTTDEIQKLNSRLNHIETLLMQISDRLNKADKLEELETCICQECEKVRLYSEFGEGDYMCKRCRKEFDNA